MSNFGKLHGAQRITFVSNNNTLYSGTSETDIPVEQIGIFQKDGQAQYKGTTSPSVVKNRKFKIVQGFPNEYSEITKYAGIPTFNHQSVEFTADQIVGWDGTKGKPFTKENVVALGYDGVDTTKTLKLDQGKGIKLYMHLRGFPAHLVQNSTQRSLKREYYIEPDILPDGVEPGSPQSCEILQQRIIDQLNRDKFHKIPITKLVKAGKITKCDVDPVAPTTLDFTEYTVQVPDNGSNYALGVVQSQYVGKEVKRIDYTDITSTYKLTQLASDSAPSAVSISRMKALTNCSSCPSGFTKVDSALVFEVTYPAGATPISISGAGVQISRTKLAGDSVKDVYQYLIKNDQNVTTITTTITTDNAAAEVVYEGLSREICTPPSAVTYSWTSGATVRKAPKTYFLTLKDTVCGASRLAELQAAYPSLTISVATTGTCARKYQTTVYSRPVTDETCTIESYQWDRPASFSAEPWIPVTDATPTDLSCKCGIIFEGARYVQKVNETTYPYFGHDQRFYDPVYIDLSTHSFDYTETLYDLKNTPVTKLQEADFPIGNGRDVIEAELESLNYFLKRYNFHPIVRETYNDKFIAKADRYYDEYRLRLRVGKPTDTIFDTPDILYRFFFPVGEGKAFEAAINKLVEAADRGLTLVNL